MKSSLKGIKKRSIFFVLNDVLVPGRLLKTSSKVKVSKLLSFLKGLEDNGVIGIFLIVGQREEKASEKIKSGVGKFFKNQNIFYVNDEYISSKEQVDKERHIAQLEKDPEFIDEFFAQKTIMDLINCKKVAREECVFVGHDIQLHAFYTARFSKIDTVLVKSSLSERNVEYKYPLKWMNLVELTVKDFTKVLEWKFPITDSKIVEAHVFNRLKTEFLQDVDLSGLIKKSIEKKDMANQ